MRRFALSYIILVTAALAFGAQLAWADTIQIPLVTSYDVSASTESGTSVAIALNATSTTDGAILTYSIESAPAHGSLGTPGADGSVLYTPEDGYSGPDSFTYKATQPPVFASNISTVSITINAAVPLDTTPPIITAPTTQSFATTTFPASPTLTPATATDDTDPSPVITFQPLEFSVGTTTVVWTATDASGNSATTTSFVVITDASAPDPVAPSPEPLSSPAPGGNGPPVGYISAPVNVPPPPAPEPAPAAEEPVTAASASAPNPETPSAQASQNEVVPQASLGSASIHIAAVLAAEAHPEPEATPATTSTVRAVAAVATAAPVRSFDYIGLLILLLLVLLAVYYEWRRDRRESRAAL